MRGLRQTSQLPKCFIQFFLYGQLNFNADDDDSFELYLKYYDKEPGFKKGPSLKELWEQHRETLTKEFKRQHPGEEPYAVEYFEEDEDEK